MSNFKIFIFPFFLTPGEGCPSASLINKPSKEVTADVRFRHAFNFMRVEGLHFLIRYYVPAFVVTGTPAGTSAAIAALAAMSAVRYSRCNQLFVMLDIVFVLLIILLVLRPV